MRKSAKVQPNSISPPPAPVPAAPVIDHKVILAHPLEMPAHLTTAAVEGWAFLAIADCRSTNEHAAYFRRAQP